MSWSSVTIAATKPALNFQFTPEQSVVLRANLDDIKRYVGYIVNNTSRCGGCGVWGDDHEGGGGMGYSCSTRRVEEKSNVQLQSQYLTRGMYYSLLIIDDILNNVEINFGDGSEAKQNAKLLLNEWQSFVDTVNACAKLYVPTKNIHIFSFDLNSMTKTHREMLELFHQLYGIKQ